MILPLEYPNLPKGRVCDAAVSGFSAALLKKLSELNINPLITIDSPYLRKEINYHTDMLAVNLGKGYISADESQKKNIVNFLTKGYTCDFISEKVMTPYPHDSLLNCVFIKNKLICNPDTVCREITEYAELNSITVIPVKQGYTKCSVCVVSDNALITDDESIFKACVSNNMDTLFISKGSVKLNGFDYGFIGGCTGLIDKDKLLFNGDINYHKDCNRITDFLNIYNIKPVIIENEPLYDIGGIIPLTEEIIAV